MKLNSKELELKKEFGKPQELHQRTKNGKVQNWKIWVVEKGKSELPEVHVEFGLTDGKKQTTFDVIETGVNTGKANETSALEQAYLEMKRKITKQLEDGYKTTVEEALEEQAIDFSKPLPKELCFYKPKNKIEDDKLAKLEKSNKAVLVLKRDGQMYLARSSDLGDIEIWSRKMDLATDKFPHVKEALKKLPKKTILLGEMVYQNKDGSDNFKLASSICRSDPPVALEKQKEIGKLKYYVFDLAFLEGKNLLTTKRFSERRKELEKLNIESEHVVLATIFKKNCAETMEYVEKKGLEGLVVWDDSQLIESKNAFSFNGTAQRPNCVFKRKNFKEDDFIVRFDPANKIGEYGKGKLKDWIGSAFIYQILDGKEMWLGKVGGGLSEELRKYYTDPKLYPLVWTLKYEFAQPGSGKLRFPVYLRDRTAIGDKTVEECLMSEEIIAARQEEEENE